MFKLRHYISGLGHLVIVKVFSSLIESHLLSLSEIKLGLDHTWLPLMSFRCFFRRFSKNQALTNWGSLSDAHFSDRILHSGCCSSILFASWRSWLSWWPWTSRTILEDLTIPLLVDLPGQSQSVARLHLMLRVHWGSLLITFVKPLVLTIGHLIALKVFSGRVRISTYLI